MASVYYYILMWLPYFFENLGGGNYTTLFSTCYPISYTLGTFLLAPIKAKFDHNLGPLFLTIMVVSTLLTFALWPLGDDPS